MIFAKSRFFTRKKRIALLKQIPTDETKMAYETVQKARARLIKTSLFICKV